MDFKNMPKSRNKRKNGKVKSGKAVKVTKTDKAKIQNAFVRKLSEYSQMTLEELEELRDNNDVTGTYARALEIMISSKKNAGND